MKLLEEAGLPAGVINFVPGRGGQVGDPVMASTRTWPACTSPARTAVFQRHVEDHRRQHRASYEQLPAHRGRDRRQGLRLRPPSRRRRRPGHRPGPRRLRVPGPEVLGRQPRLHPANPLAGRARSACWPRSAAHQDGRRHRLPQLHERGDRPGTPTTSIKGYIDRAKQGPRQGEILAGGECDDSKGYFIEPTVIQAKDPDFKIMEEEIFGPVLTVYVYPDEGPATKTLRAVRHAPRPTR